MGGLFQKGKPRWWRLFLVLPTSLGGLGFWLEVSLFAFFNFFFGVKKTELQIFSHYIFLPFRRKQRGRFFLDFSPSSSSLHKENGIENRNIFLLFVCRKPKRITDNNKIENTEQSPSLPHISTHWENVIILDGAHLDSFLYSPFLMLRQLGKGRKKWDRWFVSFYSINIKPINKWSWPNKCVCGMEL